MLKAINSHQRAWEKIAFQSERKTIHTRHHPVYPGGPRFLRQGWIARTSRAMTAVRGRFLQTEMLYLFIIATDSSQNHFALLGPML
ncbi:hypothetical protein ACFOOL_15315 [Devosia honganensis]|uniref:Uncharacterized protein n=1 Tax=Devosia honganensis TaxID=1610527 RepID=A0ABV7X7V0_9HYPH